jgi:hypothetical protein
MFDKEVFIRGKHAAYIRSLRDKAKVFERYLDAYILAPIIGFLYGRTAEPDKSSEDAANINVVQIISVSDTLKFIYRLIMLVDESIAKDPEVRINKAFKDDTDEEALNENMKIFNSYVLGGLEVLYEKFSEGCVTEDDFLDKVYEFVENFYADSCVSPEMLKEKVEEYIY